MPDILYLQLQFICESRVILIYIFDIFSWHNNGCRHILLICDRSSGARDVYNSVDNLKKSAQ